MPASTKRPFLRHLDSLIGPGATTAELLLQFLPPTIFLLLILLYSPLPIPLRLLSAILAFDLLGGVLTNSTTTAKRYYHSPARTGRHRLAFVAPHVLHVLLVAAVYRPMDMFFLVSMTAYLLLAAAIIVYVDSFVQRPVAMLLLCAGLMLDLYVWTPTPGLEWFVPLFFLKLLVAHLLPS